MLARKNRISRKEFPSFKTKGTRFFSTIFSATVYLAPDNTQFSVVVSKKVAKRAVDRNQLRRQFYSAVEPHLKTITKKIKVVIYPKKEALVTTFSFLQSEVVIMLKTAKLIP